MAENIQLAVRGWQHADWCGSFYPEDLPVDWQLSYYSNEFDAVLVPADYWNAQNLQLSTDWCEQVQPRFHFYVEWPAALPDSALPRFCEQLAAMANNLAGLILEAPLRAAQLHSLQQQCPGLQCYFWQDLWTPDARPPAQHEAPLAVLARPWSDLRELRRWLEVFAPKHGVARQALLCTMPQPKILQLQQARTLLQIMGL